MTRPALALTLLCSCALAAAQTPGTPRNWPRIAEFPPGTPILVHQPYQRYATACLLAWIDVTALACDIPDPDGATTRVVFPAASVDSVRRDTSSADPNHHSAAPMLIGMVIGGGLGAAIGARAGVGPAFAIGALGAGAGAGFAASANSGFPNQPRPQFGVRFPVGSRPPLRARFR